KGSGWRSGFARRRGDGHAILVIRPTGQQTLGREVQVAAGMPFAPHHKGKGVLSLRFSTSSLGCSRRSAMKKVQDVMTKGAECVSPSTTLQDAARKMRNMDVGPLPVCDNDRLVGMITDRDITVRAVADGCDTVTALVREGM